MDERIKQLLASVPAETLSRVASAVLGSAVSDAGPLSLAEITTPHAEQRTVAIVRVAGRAGGRIWSSVVKVLDMSIPAVPRLIGSTAPETEEIVYEERYFADRASGLRPARCYAVSRPAALLKLLWLEDLTGAAAPPFTLDQLREMSVQFGAWNGEHVARPSTLKFPLLRNTFVPRFQTWDFRTKLKQLAAMWDAPPTRAMYRDAPISVAAELLEATQQLVERGATLTGTLAYGDCSAGNLFFLDGRTVGIDWASLTLDPTGVDAGCLIGSSITWGPDFAAIVPRERELYECYLEGLRSSGWNGDADVIRLGYFCQFGFYACASLMMPINLSGVDSFLSASFFEKRYGMPIAEIPEHAAAIVDHAPRIAAEMWALLG